MEQPKRFIELDIWRGMATMGMVLFHFIFLLDFLEVRQFSYNEGAWHVLARLVQWSFLLLVGIGISLSSQKHSIQKKRKVDFILQSFKRGGFIFMCGVLITLVTAVAVPEAYVRFGILHLIGVSIILLSFFANHPRWCLALSLFIYAASIIINAQFVSHEWLLIFGFRYPFQSLDYFSIFPWMAIPALGVFIGSVLYLSPRKEFYVPSQIQNPILNGVALLGKKSLFIYMIHIPILLVLIELFFFL